MGTSRVLTAARLAAAMTAAAVAMGAAGALAQGVATYDFRQLPVTHGRVAQYSLTPRGDVDGVILEDGTQVHMPPHLGGQIVRAVQPGERVTILGLKAQALPLIQALSMTGDASGQTVTDLGPPIGPPNGPRLPLATPYRCLAVEGRVREKLYGPRGDMNGALLDDGTQVHLAPGEAWMVADELQAGHVLVARGCGVDGAYGRSLDARQIGPSAAQLRQVARPDPPAPPNPASPHLPVP